METTILLALLAGAFGTATLFLGLLCRTRAKYIDNLTETYLQESQEVTENIKQIIEERDALGNRLYSIRDNTWFCDELYIGVRYGCEQELTIRDMSLFENLGIIGLTFYMKEAPPQPTEEDDNERFYALGPCLLFEVLEGAYLWKELSL